jgi:hypothetical protein
MGTSCAQPFLSAILFLAIPPPFSLIPIAVSVDQPFANHCELRSAPLRVPAPLRYHWLADDITADSLPRQEQFTILAVRDTQATHLELPRAPHHVGHLQAQRARA